MTLTNDTRDIITNPVHQHTLLSMHYVVALLHLSRGVSSGGIPPEEDFMHFMHESEELWE